MDNAEIINSVSNSMNDLLYNTSQLAAITGQNTREMRRNVQKTMDDPVVTSLFATLSSSSEKASQNLKNMSGILGKAGDAGIQFSQATIKAMGTNRDIFTVMPEELRRGMQLTGIEFETGFRDIFNFIQENYESMDPTEFGNKLTTLVANIDTPELRERLQNLAVSRGDMASSANMILNMINNLGGLNKSLEENTEASSQAGQAVKDAAWMAIPAELQNTANAIKESILAETLKQLGIDTDATGKVFVEKLRELNSNIENNGLLKTATDTAMSGVGNFISEHPIISSVVGLAGLAGLGTGRAVQLGQCHGDRTAARSESGHPLVVLGHDSSLRIGRIGFGDPSRALEQPARQRQALAGRRRRLVPGAQVASVYPRDRWLDGPVCCRLCRERRRGAEPCT